jgi:hypothetical protein
MVIKVVGISFAAHYYNQHHPQQQTRFYTPQTPKEEVKQDFGLVLDEQIKGLKFNKII